MYFPTCWPQNHITGTQRLAISDSTVCMTAPLTVVLMSHFLSICSALLGSRRDRNAPRSPIFQLCGLGKRSFFHLRLRLQHLIAVLVAPPVGIGVYRLKSFSYCFAQRRTSMPSRGYRSGLSCSSALFSNLFSISCCWALRASTSAFVKCKVFDCTLILMCKDFRERSLNAATPSL